MSDEVTRQAEARVGREDYDWMVVDRDTWQAVATKATADRDAARADLKQAEENNRGLMIEVQNMRAGLEVVTEERDAAEEKCRKLHSENEGLRADALAYPPQRLDIQQYANLKADYDLQATMVETLQDALKRTEAMLAKAQGQHIDDRLKGFLAVISQLADQSQDLLP